MSSVSDEPRGPLRLPFGARWVGVMAVISLVAGPGFLSAALINALYRDVPSTVAHQSASERVASKVSAEGLSNNRLSPVAERIAPSIPTSPGEARSSAPSSNPLKAYLQLTGTSEYSALPARTSAASAQHAKSSFRTVCVRLCDGSYFPISERATSDQLSQDEAQCQSSCGSPARLYIYSKDRETPLQMRDLSGNSYLELDSAFRFHTTYDAQCTCRAQPWTLASRQLHRRYEEATLANQSERAVLPVAANAKKVTPKELATISAAVSVNAATDEQTILAIGANSNGSNRGAVQTLQSRSATPAEVALLDAERKKSIRLEAVAKRAAFVASLKLPRLHGSREAIEVAAVAKPNPPGTPSFLTLNPATYAAAEGTQAVALAELSAPTRDRAPPSATDILMRNINPQF